MMSEAKILPYQVWVYRDGPIWEGHWGLAYHTHDAQDALWYGRHGVERTPPVKRIELRCEDKALCTLFERGK